MPPFYTTEMGQTMSDGEYFGRWIMSVPEMAPGEKRVVGYADYIDSPGSIAHFYFGVNVMNAGYSDTVNGSIAIVVTAPNGEEFRMDSNIDFQGEMYEDNNHVVDGFGTVWIQAFDNASIEDYENDSYSGTESSRFFAIVFPDQITDNGFNTSPRPSDDPAYNGRWLFSIENNSDADYTPIYVVHALNLEEDVGERYLAVGLVGTTAQNPSDDSSALSGDLWIQSGANQNDGVWLSTYDCRAVTLGVDKLYTDPRDMAEQSSDKHGQHVPCGRRSEAKPP